MAPAYVYAEEGLAAGYTVPFLVKDDCIYAMTCKAQITKLTHLLPPESNKICGN